ncbi:hypothetical protein [Saccharopolyspora phatthalungensis]|uniref:Tetratricopeptide repeat protein n=1 Tax=Saccharopolyspora phatthalungensis TaxID=664693 RepID=A0A840QGU3_9PSEU|nr:hypothetical protein [Saccharopolyspora phatthalungensis]MBB5159347.1 hypothetical protein [Saccharopolyspora phatthalungensis]
MAIAGLVGIVGVFLPEGIVPPTLVYIGLAAAATLAVTAILGYANWRGSKLRAQRIHARLRANDPRKALPELRTLVADLERVAGQDDPITMEWRQVLARTQRDVGQLADALRTGKLNVECRTRALGHDHPRTKESRRDLQMLLREIEGG